MNEKNYESEVEVIIPTLNEEKTIGSIIERTLIYANKVLVIDGRSEDGTIKIARENGAQIKIQNGRGKGAALKDAFFHANSKIIVMLDGDGSMRPEEIPLFLKEIDAGADLVKGSRFLDNGGSEDITFLRKFGNFLFLFLVNKICNSNFTDLCYGFMAFNKNATKRLRPILRSKGFNIEAEIIIKAKKLDLKIVEIPSFELNRLYGKSKLNTMKDGFKIFATILKESLNMNGSLEIN